MTGAEKRAPIARPAYPEPVEGCAPAREAADSGNMPGNRQRVCVDRPGTSGVGDAVRGAGRLGRQLPLRMVAA